MKFSVVIPARYASTRLAEKPLLDIAGKSMVERVFLQAKKSDASSVVIATDHEKIFTHVKKFTDDVVMTNQAHPSGTDRLQEVTSILNLSDDELVVNVQGDEPLLPPEAINQVAANLIANNWADCSTLCAEIVDTDELFNPNAVKVVKANNGNALYFSRAPMPWDRDHFEDSKSKKEILSLSGNWFRHNGLYAYRVSTLNAFTQLSQSMLEKTEKLEQLRLLENGFSMHVEPSHQLIPGGVDTQEDLDRVRTLISE